MLLLSILQEDNYGNHFVRFSVGPCANESLLATLMTMVAHPTNGSSSFLLLSLLPSASWDHVASEPSIYKFLPQALIFLEGGEEGNPN